MRRFPAILSLLLFNLLSSNFSQAAPVITSISLDPPPSGFSAGDIIAEFTGSGVSISSGIETYTLDGNAVQLTSDGATTFNSGAAFPLLGLSDGTDQTYLVTKHFPVTQDLEVSRSNPDLRIRDLKTMALRRQDANYSRHAAAYLKLDTEGIAPGPGDSLQRARLNLFTTSGNGRSAGAISLFRLNYGPPVNINGWGADWTEDSFTVDPIDQRPYTTAAPFLSGNLVPSLTEDLGTVQVPDSSNALVSFDLSGASSLEGNIGLLLLSGEEAGSPNEDNRYYFHTRTADNEALRPFLTVSYLTSSPIVANPDTLTVHEGSRNLQDSLELLGNDLLFNELFDPNIHHAGEESEHPLLHSLNGTDFEQLADSTHQTFVGRFGYKQVPGSHGTLYLRKTGQTFYVHDKANLASPVTDSFTYTVEDDEIISPSGTLTVTITPGNQAPVLELEEKNFNPVAQTPDPADAGDIAATFATSDPDGDLLEVYWLTSSGTSPRDSSGNDLYELNRTAGTVTLTSAGAALVNTPAELPAISLAVYDTGGKSQFANAHPYVAPGDVYYIDNTNGNDSNDGLTPATAFKTDAAVTDKVAGEQFLQPGATVYLLGEYIHESFDPNFSYDPNVADDPYIWRNEITTFKFRQIEGTAALPITIKGWDDTAIIRSDDSGCLVIDDCKYIRVIGLDCEGPAGRMPLQTALDLQFLYRKKLADVIPADDRFPATNPADDPINGTEISDGTYKYFYRVPYGSTAEDVEENYSQPGTLAKISKTQRPVLTDTKSILVRNSQYIDILYNHVHHAASTGLRAQESEMVRIIGNEINDCSRKASVGTMGMVARNTLDEIAVLPDKSNLYKIIMANNFIHHNYNEVFSWVGGKDFITPELDEGKGLSLEWQEAPSWNQPDSDGRILLMNNVTWLNAVSGVNNHGGDRVDVVGNTSFMNSTYSSLFGFSRSSNIGITHEPDSRNANENYGTDVRYWNNLAVTTKGQTGFGIRVNADSPRVPENFVTYDGAGNIAFGPDDRKSDLNVADNIFVADVDPLFFDPENADFRIPLNSPVREIAASLDSAAGWDIPAELLSRDANGILRSTADVGALEAFEPLTGYQAFLRENLDDPTFTSGLNLAPSDDLDGDGIINLLEYAFGTNPDLDDTAIFETRKLSSMGEDLTDLPILSFSLPTSRLDLTYTIEESPSLENASWTPSDPADFQITTSASGGLTTETWTHQGIAPLTDALFYRLKIELN